MGEHKGSGLAIMCELLAGALTGGWTAQPGHPQAGGIINNMLSVIIDPDAFGGRRRLRARSRRWSAYVKSAPAARGLRRGAGAGRARAAPARRAPGRRHRGRRAHLGRDPRGARADVGVDDAQIDAAESPRARMERVDCVVIGAGRGRPRDGAPAGAGRPRGDDPRGRRHDRHRDQLAQQRGDPRRDLLPDRARSRRAAASPASTGFTPTVPSTACRIARCGKLIVATSEAQNATLEQIRAKAAANGVDDLEWLEPDAGRCARARGVLHRRRCCRPRPASSTATA